MTEPQQKHRRWPLIVFVCGLLAMAIGMVVLLSPQDTGPRRPMPRSRHIKAYGIALRMYANDHDTLPYSPDGTAAALYGLKDYLDTGDAAPQPPSFDDEHRLLTNCPFDYINAADLTLDNLPPMLVLLAEHQPDTNGGRYCLPADGHSRYIQADKSCAVGEELDETGP